MGKTSCNLVEKLVLQVRNNVIAFQGMSFFVNSRICFIETVIRNLFNYFKSFIISLKTNKNKLLSQKDILNFPFRFNKIMVQNLFIYSERFVQNFKK